MRCTEIKKERIKRERETGDIKKKKKLSSKPTINLMQTTKGGRHKKKAALPSVTTKTHAPKVHLKKKKKREKGSPSRLIFFCLSPTNEVRHVTTEIKRKYTAWS
jgi:hypothetical protein